MSDLSITAANVVAGANSRTARGIAGETITAGQAVYLDSASKKYLKADADSATAAARQPSGIALNGAALNQPIIVHESGLLTLGATLVAGLAYYLSGGAGGICPVADIGTGEYVCLIGLATSTTVIDVDIKYTGVSH